MKALSEGLANGLTAAPLAVVDVAAAVAPSSEAGWNQADADWRLTISPGEATGVRDATGALSATALVLPFDGPFSWISVVLGTGAHRRRGTATAPMAHCMDRLDALAPTPVPDATDAGRQVYGPHGFKPVHGLRRQLG